MHQVVPNRAPTHNYGLRNIKFHKCGEKIIMEGRVSFFFQLLTLFKFFDQIFVQDEKKCIFQLLDCVNVSCLYAPEIVGLLLCTVGLLMRIKLHALKYVKISN